jgi:polyhydroxyalkanoate synthesis regulator protein
MAATPPIVIKRYRDRLYDQGAGRYVSLEDLRTWAAADIAFVVRDALSGEDLTLALLSSAETRH